MTRTGTLQTHAAIVGGLLSAAALAWWSTAERMEGMSGAPGTNLGTVGWFIVTWAMMTAAMMLPSLAPVAVATNAARRDITSRTVLFVSGYLLVWTLAGIATYAVLKMGNELAGLRWTSEGSWVSAVVLMLAAGYELTALKRACLTRCRRPTRDASDRVTTGRSARLPMAPSRASGAWAARGR